jgi:hypothetical protein
VGTFLSTWYTFGTVLIYPSELPNANYYSFWCSQVSEKSISFVGTSPDVARLSFC